MVDPGTGQDLTVAATPEISCVAVIPAFLLKKEPRSGGPFLSVSLYFYIQNLSIVLNNNVNALITQ